VELQGGIFNVENITNNLFTTDSIPTVQTRDIR
jgi:hypothetical protein